MALRKIMEIQPSLPFDSIFIVYFKEKYKLFVDREVNK